MPDPTTPQQVTDKAVELLKDNRGVFIGERHDSALASDFLLSNLDALKAAGVTTIYIESNTYKLEAMREGKEGRDAYMGGADPDWQMSTLQKVAMEATAKGFRVIGHDDVVGDNKQWDRIDKSEKVLSDLLIGREALDRRDDYAANLIEKTYDGGKFVVYGGSAHSGNDADTRHEGQGLDNRLKIPSIDFDSDKEYYARESKKLAENDSVADFNAIMADKALPVHMKKGVGGEATYKVTAGVDSVFAENIPQRTPEEQATLDKMAQLSKQYGLDKLPVRLEGKEVLDKTDIDNLAARYAKPKEQQQAQAPSL